MRADERRHEHPEECHERRSYAEPRHRFARRRSGSRPLGRRGGDRGTDDGSSDGTVARVADVDRGVERPVAVHVGVGDEGDGRTSAPGRFEGDRVAVVVGEDGRAPEDCPRGVSAVGHDDGGVRDVGLEGDFGRTAVRHLGHVERRFGRLDRDVRVGEDAPVVHRGDVQRRVLGELVRVEGGGEPARRGPDRRANRRARGRVVRRFGDDGQRGPWRERRGEPHRLVRGRTDEPGRGRRDEGHLALDDHEAVGRRPVRGSGVHAVAVVGAERGSSDVVAVSEVRLDPGRVDDHVVGVVHRVADESGPGPEQPKVFPRVRRAGVRLDRRETVAGFGEERLEAFGRRRTLLDRERTLDARGVQAEDERVVHRDGPAGRHGPRPNRRG